jgi:6-hydroxymethylpterin diphosphokinase MptE-like
LSAGQGRINTTDDEVFDNVSRNIRRGLPQVRPFDPNPHNALLVCGGPSLNETEELLVRAHWDGGKVVTVNGAYQWCIDRNIRPSAAIMLDAREFNARFLEAEVPGCRYLLGAQCHPRAFEICRDRETFIWHACSLGDREVDLLNEYYFGRFYPVDIGVTVGIRALTLLRLLGFHNQEIFGLDSCFLNKQHHAYQQPEDDADQCVEVWLRPEGGDHLAQRFVCAAWHIAQYFDFLEFVKDRGDKVNLQVHGSGMIAATLRTGYTLQMAKEQAGCIAGTLATSNPKPPQ